jgi:hypothetical protein
MPGLVPGIHVLSRADCKDVDGRDKPGHDERGANRTLMSELDKVFDELAADFLSEFFEADIKPSQTLKSRGIEAHFADNKLVLHRPQSGHYEEPLYIVVGEQGEIDIAGRSLGGYQPAEKLAKKRELIGEIISFFDL